ncbi:MAG: hypothetical protein ACRDGS_16405, partial [Chloroflexota bacterium]
MLRRQTIQAPNLLALTHGPARRATPLLSPITPLARHLWEDLLARYATESAGGVAGTGALAANRELLQSLSLLALLTQRTRRAVARQSAARAATAALSAPAQAVSAASGQVGTTATGQAMLTSLPFFHPALPGLAAVAAMSASLAPVQVAIARSLEGPIPASTLGGQAPLLPGRWDETPGAAVPVLGPSGQPWVSPRNFSLAQN